MTSYSQKISLTWNIHKSLIPELIHEGLITIIESLYYVSDSGDYSDEVLRVCHLNVLDMKQYSRVLSLFFKNIDRKLVGTSVSCIYNLIRTGTKEFNNHSSLSTNQAFKTKDQTMNKVKFNGLDVQDKNDPKSNS